MKIDERIKEMTKIPTVDVTIDQLNSSMMLFLRQGYVGKRKFLMGKLGTYRDKKYVVELSVKLVKDE